MKRIILIIPLLLAACTEPDESNLLGRWESNSEICELQKHLCGITISIHETGTSSVYAQFDDRKVGRSPGGPIVKTGSNRNGTTFMITFTGFVGPNKMPLVYKNGKLYDTGDTVWERKEQ